MVILGIDPGSERAGFALLDFSGQHPQLIGTRREHLAEPSLSERLDHLHLATQNAMAHQPDIVAIEQPWHGPRTNIRSLITLSKAAGVCEAAVCKPIVPVYAYEAKLAATGKRNATKHDVATAVARMFRLDAKEIEGEIADAIAVGLAGYAKQRRAK